jgi:hypothetical protein
VSKFRKFNSYEPTTADDPQRGVWYAARCWYWTDDWSKLKTAGPSRIPCCPVCGSPGFHLPFAEWIAGAEKHQASGYPGYVDRVLASRETHRPPEGHK